MLPTTRIRPRVDLSRTLAKHHVSKPTQDVNRKHTPARAAFAPATARVSAKVSVTPTRTSLDHGHGLPTPALEAVDSSLSDIHHHTVSPSISASTQSQLSNSASAASLCGSDSELALLLSGGDLSRPGCTTINIGSIPISVPIAYVPVSADRAEQQHPAAADEPGTPAATAADVLELECTPADIDAAPATKLNPTSAEFYPSAYIAAAAATALAAQSISSSSSQIQTPPSEAADEQTHAAFDAEQQLQQQPADQASASDQAPPQQQLLPVNMEHQQQLQTWQPQQQQWQAPQWQQAMPVPVPMFFTVPVNYMMPAAYHYAWQQQQWQQQQHHMHMQQVQIQQVQVMPPMAPPAFPHPPAIASQDGSSTDLSSPPPPSPAPSLPADTSSLMSVPSAAAVHSWALNHPGPYSTRPGSSASSIVSAYAGSSRGRQQQDRLRDAGTVTVSALSCVKDAAGALAKVVNRHGSCLLLSLTRQGDIAAQATHVAAKSLAVARFYINAHMAAEGRAGVDAAAVLSGVEQAADVHQPVQQQSTDEVVFMPYTRSGGSNRAPAAVDIDEPLGFMVAKASSKDLPVLLPPPVGIPACMQDRQQQQQGQVQQDAAGAVHALQSAAPLLKAGANTDVNKLSNAIIHNILGCNHVALQLAGAAACHVAMKALIKARSRLQRKFAADIVATASFANEDTSSSIGRSTVFLRLDVLRSDILKQFADVGGAARQVASRAVSEVGEMVGTPQQQQAGPAMA